MNNLLGHLINADLQQIQSQATGLAAPAILPAAGEGAASAGFGDRFMAAVRGVNDQDHDAAGQMAAVDSGESDDLVGAMLASQQAGLSFSMLMQVRNKVMGAMDELIKLPI